MSLEERSTLSYVSEHTSAELAPSVVVDDQLTTADYAGWGRRFAAWLADGCLTWIPLFVTAATTGAVVGDPNAVGDATDELASGLIFVLGLPLIVLYHTLLRGRTPGKRVLGIAVRDESTGAGIGYGRALGRVLMTAMLWVLLYVPGILDGLWPLWDSKRQSLHDKAAGTVVVRV
jgi:uncharacterized RDD family membrane protein YckC